ncbi:MAG: hypothetical protein KF829_04955 [Ferruginibacter sp.]|nr:hypothetical protein [Ferruginibacter sp.]
MIKIVLFYSFSLFSFAAIGQNFNGQWKGSFSDNSDNNNLKSNFDEREYVLEIATTKSNTVSGTSYTYFISGGKRYYTICKITGFIDRKKHYIEIKETERVKTNIPAIIRNCFQVHKLFFSHKKDGELLSGNWVPAPNQIGNCGYGATQLERRNLQAYIKSNNRQSSNYLTKATTKPKTSSTRTAAPVTEQSKINKPHLAQTGKTSTAQSNLYVKEKKTQAPMLKSGSEIALSEYGRFKEPEMQLRENQVYARKLELIKTIQVQHPEIKVVVYDNGVVDGDSISLYFNKKLILSNLRLCDKGYTVTLPIDREKNVNELVMHAENLGTIPPNTAIMLVLDGDKRYEVRISSDLSKSGAIHFVYTGAEVAK